MAGKGLVLGIEYRDDFCQVCYYSERHGRAESVIIDAGIMRYLIPTAICYDTEGGDWLIGTAAESCSRQTGAYLFRNLLENVFTGEKVQINGRGFSYTQLLAAYLGKLIDQSEIFTSVMGVENITVSLSKVNREIKNAVEEAFGILKIDISKVKIQSPAESFAAFLLSGDEQLWLDGALLFDFGPEGFFARKLTVTGSGGRSLVYVNESSCSMDFPLRNLASMTSRAQMDARLLSLYREMKPDGARSSVYFTGEGFDEVWFKETLDAISADRRSFRGNNIYVKGACMAGFYRAAGTKAAYPVICRGRTKADISVSCRADGKFDEIVLSRAATDWYDAGCTADFILENEKKVTLYITSIVSREKSPVEFDLSGFPERPFKTTRVRVSVEYRNDSECDITVEDRGFGDFFPSGGQKVTKRLNLEGYI